MSKPLASFSSIRAPVGLAPFKGSRCEICFQDGLFVKNIFEKDQIV
jgi:hypothetical protein